MNRLELIQAPIAGELKLLHKLLREELRSSDVLLNGVVEEYLRQKGKLMRPILVLLAARLTGCTPTEKTLQAAMAIELLHNASLIHDDVVDEAPLRRGFPSVNARWGNKVAVLVGDYFVSTALRSGVATGIWGIVETLGPLGRRLAQGEIEQLDNVRRKICDESAYFRVIRGKTASLFTACMRVGALSVGASAEVLALLEAFGDRLGCCFQIKDDILDYIGGEEAMGKPRGADLREGKITLPMIYALSHASEERRSRAMALLDMQELTIRDVDTLVNFVSEEGGLDYAEQRMRNLCQEAQQILSAFPQDASVEALGEVLAYTLERDK